jgi:hypothetical protein
MDTFNPGSPLEEDACIDQLETTLDNINTWMASNRLKMNPTKTEVVMFASKATAKKVRTESIRVDQDAVQISNSLKYLGVLFDSDLSMDKHISAKCQAASINIRNIASIRRFINLDTAKLLASSLVLTHLDYSNSVLSGLPKKSITQLQRTQNWAAKVVLHRDKYSSSSDALLTLHWLPIKERIDFKVLCLVYKCLNNMAPQYLSSLIKIKTFSRVTRASTQGIILEVPMVRKATFAARAFSVYGPTLWNSIPSSIHHSPSFPVFKKRIKTELFGCAFNLNNETKKIKSN